MPSLVLNAISDAGAMQKFVTTRQSYRGQGANPAKTTSDHVLSITVPSSKLPTCAEESKPAGLAESASVATDESWRTTASGSLFDAQCSPTKTSLQPSTASPNRSSTASVAVVPLCNYPCYALIFITCALVIWAVLFFAVLPAIERKKEF